MTVQDIRDKAVQIVRMRGPLLPVHITKELGTNVMFASAILSELVDQKIIKLSHTKIGGSPLYYVQGQEPKLQALREKLNDKQQIAFDRLRQNKVLRDSEIEPVIRLSCRDIKDFAVPLNVTYEGKQELFWKWYLISDDEASMAIKDKLGLNEKKQEKEKKQEAKKAQEIPKDIQKDLSEIEEELKKINQTNQSKPEHKQIIEHAAKEEVSRTPKEQKPRKPRQSRSVQQIQQPVTAQPNQLQSQISIDETDEFMANAIKNFKENKIELVSMQQIRKNSDFEGVVRVPSVIGDMTYFCKGKNKQKITDADLSLLFVQAQMKKMPVLLVTTGDVTKKAQELLKAEFKNIAIKKI